jgi:hypothetical protein
MRDLNYFELTKKFPKRKKGENKEGRGPKACRCAMVQV